MLRLGLDAVSVRVGENERAPVANNDAAASADVAGGAGMAGRIEVAGDDAITRGKARLEFRIVAQRDAAADAPGWGSIRIRPEPAVIGGRCARSESRGAVRIGGRRGSGAVENTFFLEQRFEGEEPMLVVGGIEIVRGRHPLDRAAELVHVGEARAHYAQSECERPALPVVMEHRLVTLRFDGAETMHPAEIVNPVHGWNARRGARRGQAEKMLGYGGRAERPRFQRRDSTAILTTGPDNAPK